MTDLTLARKVLVTEADAVRALADRLDARFSAAVALVRDCRGRVILTGMGKSGIVCRKIAATLSSTGSPAYFVHPAEAVHGDLGMIQRDDVVIALSHSGETEELTRLLETLKRMGATLIAMTGNPASTLARAATVVLDCTDNFATRQAVNAACVAARVPLVSGSAIRFDGQLAVYDSREPNSPCYACLFPLGSSPEQAQCATMGVFAPLTGVIGSLQAAEALKLLAGGFPGSTGALWMLDGKHLEWSRVAVSRRADCEVCARSH